MFSKQNPLTTGLLALAWPVKGFATSPSTQACSDLAQHFEYPGTSINFAKYVSAGTNVSFSQEGPLASCAQAPLVVPADLCRIALFVKTSQESNLTMEAWLPTNWTGRFLSVGNGGLNGCIDYNDLAYTVGYGFAAVGTNNGHNGTSGAPFYGNEESVVDFAYRAMHTGVVVGKSISKAYYGMPHNKSYYLGCSTGGRQGFKAAQDFPDDFDGIVAGAPAVSFNELISWSAHFSELSQTSAANTILTNTTVNIIPSNTSAEYLSLAEWAMVHHDVLKQCDGLDGAVDGIIEASELCQYTPVSLQCPHAQQGKNLGCLTATQVATVQKTFAPFYGLNGTLIYPRLPPGPEIVASQILLNGAPFPYSADWFRYVVYNNPSYDPYGFDLEDAAAAIKLNPGDIATWKGDLSAYKGKGGKILHYHGETDPIISTENSPRYYEHVATTMEQPPSKLDEFYRFFRVGGMQHCSGGPGAWQIGQQGTGAAGNPEDPQHNVLLRMVDWVEKGNAPETITGLKFVNDTQSLGIDFIRDHCKYPLRNQCIDPANHKDPKAWKCVP